MFITEYCRRSAIGPGLLLPHLRSLLRQNGEFKPAAASAEYKWSNILCPPLKQNYSKYVQLYFSFIYTQLSAMPYKYFPLSAMPYKYFPCKLCCSLLQGEFHFESVVLLDLVKDVINKIILL